MRFEHEIFQGPLSVDRSTTRKVDPHTKKEIDAWRVHEETAEPGLVATRRFFVNAPDSEIISGGINMKGDRGVPLVREGNLFLWGFNGSPAIMTDAGKAAFVNTLVYMSKHEGEPVVRRADVYSSGNWKDILASQYVTTTHQLSRYFSQAMVKEFGEDKDAYRALFSDNADYVWVPPGTNVYHIDDEARGFGLPVGSLDLMAAAIESKKPEAAAVLARYWPDDDLLRPIPDSADELQAIAGDIYFSEYHGYRWLSKPPLAGPEGWEIEDALDLAPMPEPTGRAPVALRTRTVTSFNGELRAYDVRFGLATIVIEGAILDEWHVTIDAGDGHAVPVLSAEYELPDGARLWGEPRLVAEEKHVDPKTGVTEARGGFRLLQDVWLTCEPGMHKIGGTVRFQACDETMCLPPAALDFEDEIRVR